MLARLWPVWLAAILAAPAAWADVVVIYNPTPRAVSFTLGMRGEAAEHTLDPGEARALPTSGPVAFQYLQGQQPVRYRLDPNACYRFGITSDSRLTFHHIDLGEPPSSAGDAPRRAVEAGENDAPSESAPQQPRDRIAIKVLVDDDEPATRAVWEQRLRKRIDAVSEILESECRLRLHVVAWDTWHSNNNARDFSQTLAEFIDGVDPAPGVLAIGFTSQYEIAPDSHFGSGCQPLGRHILLRERSRHVSEAERMEALLHSLGHWLGATHSNHPASVMRPVLADRKARSADFRIRFDPLNLLAINLVSEDIRARGVLEAGTVSAPTLARLQRIHEAALPRKLVHSDLPIVRRPEPEPRPDPRVAQAPAPQPGQDQARPPDEAEPTVSPDGAADVAQRRAPTQPPLPELEEPDPNAPPDAAALEERRRLQGRWKVVSAERNGRPYETAVGLKPVFHEEFLTVRSDVGTFRFRFKLYPPRRPAEDRAEHRPFDLVLEYQNQTLVAKGIYQIDRNTATLTAICAEPGDPRPTEFKTEERDGRALLVIERVP